MEITVLFYEHGCEYLPDPLACAEDIFCSGDYSEDMHQARRRVAAYIRNARKAGASAAVVDSGETYFVYWPDSTTEVIDIDPDPLKVSDIRRLSGTRRPMILELPE